MSISNLSSGAIRQDQSLYRKLMREDGVDAASMGQMPMTQITITVGSGSPSQGNSAQQISVGSTGRSSLMAMMNSVGIENSPPPAPPPGAVSLASDISSLFEALESGDEEAATAAAERIEAILDGVSTSKTSDTTSTDTETETTTETDTDEPEFITSLKSILGAVSEADFETAKTEASALADSISVMRPPAGPPPQGGMQPGGEAAGVMGDVSELLAAVGEGDMETAATLAESIRDSLPGLDDSTTEATGESFEIDLAALLNAIERGDETAAADAASTIDEALSRAAPATSPESDQTLSSNIETALNSLEDSSSTSSAESTAFVESLKDLLEALKSGSNVDQKLKSVLEAYSATESTTT